MYEIEFLRRYNGQKVGVVHFTEFDDYRRTVVELINTHGLKQIPLNRLNEKRYAVHPHGQDGIVVVTREITTKPKTRALELANRLFAGRTHEHQL